MSYANTTAYGQALNDEQKDEWARAVALLTSYGLDGLSSNLEDWLVEGYNGEEILQRLRETNEYKTRFRAIEERRKANLPPISEADVVNTERSMAQVMQQAGLPKSFYDSPDDFTNLIARDVSPSEFQARITEGYVAVRNDPRVQQQLQGLYGMGASEGDLVAFYLDPDAALSAIQRKQAAAAMAAQSVSTGYGQLSVNDAESLAGRGITADQAQQGFSSLAEREPLFNPLASEQGVITKEQQLSAAFDNNAAAQRVIDVRRRERQSKFEGGGGFQTSKFGMTGAGSSNV